FASESLSLLNRKAIRVVECKHGLTVQQCCSLREFVKYFPSGRLEVSKASSDYFSTDVTRGRTSQNVVATRLDIVQQFVLLWFNSSAQEAFEVFRCIRPQ